MVVGSMTVDTDVLIIGSGPGGYVAAIRAAQLGKEVMVVEKEKVVGGICLHHGCIPTKALIHASTMYHSIDSMKTMGIEIPSATINVDALISWKDKILFGLEGGIQSLFKKYGIEVITGTAVFTSATQVHIQGQSDVTAINFKQCIIATGSVPIELPQFPFSHQRVISSRQALGLRLKPKDLVIIGGGYIGTEMATVYGKLGTNVHLLEMGDHLIESLEHDLVDVVSKRLEKFNVTFHTNTQAVGFTENGERLSVHIKTGEEQTNLEADYVLVVVGRKPNTKELDLDKAGVKMNEKGFITVDEQMRTNQPHIFAIGDVVGQPMLAHKASHEGKIAAEVICGKESYFDNAVIPAVVYNDPEIMSVGLTEKAAQEQGKEVIVGKFPFSALGRSHTMNEPDGFIKVVAEKETERVLGVHAVGAHVSELTGEAALAIEMGSVLEDIILTI
ncbi:MAG: dihydrolipoyl dehydrogenase, partial [Nanoarchaeota archaeon]|nr:dihydrolipoyl dehydrogenase [Nanoarchaeota archaeon]